MIQVRFFLQVSARGSHEVFLIKSWRTPEDGSEAFPCLGLQHLVPYPRNPRVVFLGSELSLEDYLRFRISERCPLLNRATVG